MISDVQLVLRQLKPIYGARMDRLWQVDAGKRPEQFGRIWLHTHPGESPTPSNVDEETFGRVFGRCDWSVMFILARGGKTYARLRFGVGPGGDLMVPVEVDYRAAFAASDHDSWSKEYQTHVLAEPMDRFPFEPMLDREKRPDRFGALEVDGRDTITGDLEDSLDMIWRCPESEVWR